MKDDHFANITPFDRCRECTLCHDQNSADGSVHHGSVIGREMEVGRIPAGLPLFEGRVICATCHNPHLRAAGAPVCGNLEDFTHCVGCRRD